MSPRAFMIISAAAAIALIAAIVLLLVEQGTATPRSTGGDPMFPDLVAEIDDLGEVLIEGPRYSLRAALRDDRWVATNYGDYPINVDMFAEIVGSLLSMTKVEPKTANPELYQYIGVTDVETDEAGETLRIRATSTGDEVLMDAIFGWPSASIGFTRVGGTFVRPTESAQSWLVEGVIYAPPFIQDWFETLLNVPGTDVASVSVNAGDTVLLTAAKVDFTNADYELTYLNDEVGPENSTANDANLRGMTQGIISTTFDAARPIGELTLGDDDRVVTFITIGGLRLVVRLVDLDGEVWVTYEASAPEGSPAVELAAGITERTEHWAFQIPSHRVNALSRPVGDLLVAPVDDTAEPAGAPARPFIPIAP